MSVLDSIHVVVVDDEARTRERVLAALRGRGHRATGLESATQLLALTHRTPIDVVILDVILEGMTGVDAVRLLRADGRPYLGIILLTARNDAQSRVEGLRLGADDYVGKPFDDAELVARVEALARAKRRFDTELAVARRPRAGDDGVDALTGLWTASVVDARIQEEWQRAIRHRDPFAVAMLSLRDPSWDAAAKADALRTLATDLLGVLRVGDLAARITEEEVVVVLPGAHVGSALPLVQQMQEALSQRAGVLAWGLAVCPSPSVVSREDLVRAAHSALRQAEREGAGAICLQEERAWILDPAS